MPTSPVLSSFASGPAGDFTLPSTKTSLGQEPDFTLGGVQVSPSQGLIFDGASEHRVTPQVMQALLVLLRAEGRTVTRDELVDACWGGRVVSDDAINRVIALVRGVERQFDPPPFHLHTIPKIGFRLDAPQGQPVAQAPSPPVDTPSSPADRPDRRVLIGAAGAAVLAGLGGAGWWAAAKRLPKPARAAIESGMIAFRQSTPDQMTQAIAAFQRATRLAPRHAEGWGLLAMAYRYQIMMGAPPSEVPGLAQRLREAANRALAIEPDNPDAQAALVTLQPSADWIGANRVVSAQLARNPRNLWANWGGVDFYTHTGQLDLAHRCAQAALATDPGWPKLYSALTQTCWSMGQLEAADDWIARGIAQWPRYYSLWFIRFRLLSYTGRAAQALEMIEDRDRRPLGIPEWNFDQGRQEARALLTHAPADIDAAVAAYRAAIPRGIGFAQNAVQFFSVTRRLDEAFAVLETLFADQGQRAGGVRYSSEQGQYFAPGRMETWVLWMPALAAMRADPRMLPIVRKIGLVDYWRATGSKPATPIAGL